MTTNAQAALQAAATIYTGGPTANPIVRAGEVRELAERFKTWLDTSDRLDEQDRQTRESTRDICPMENPYDEHCTYDAGHQGAHSFQLSNTGHRAQGSADRRGTGKRARQCQAIGGTYGSVCYYPAGHDGVHSWQSHQ